MHPLTHHDIIERVAPFSRSGRRVDLAASDRLERRLAFRPIDRPAPSQGDPAVVEVLELRELAQGSHRLVRTVTIERGSTARLEADGADVAALLRCIDGIAPHRHFRCESGVTVATSHRVPEEGVLVLTEATAEIDGLQLGMTIADPRSRDAELALTMPGDASFDLPDDLLAVLGPRWSVLRRTTDGWRASLRLKRPEPRRSDDAEADLRQAVRHLASTFTEKPASFHDRWARARWTVTARRAIPALICVALIVGAMAVTSLDLAGDSVARMLIFNAPPLMLVVFFCLRDLPQIVIPPLPRRSTRATWDAPPRR